MLKNVQIVGMDAFPCGESPKAMALLFQHVRQLRANPYLTDAYIVLIAERNTGHESGHYYELLKQFPRTAAFNEPSRQQLTQEQRGKAASNSNYATQLFDTEKDPGFTTINAFKMQAKEALENILYQNILYIMEGCISGNPFLPNMPEMEERIIYYHMQLVEQMSRARVYPTKSQEGSYMATKYTWSATVNEENKKVDSFKDDLVVILAFGIFIAKKACDSYLVGFPYNEIGWHR